MAITQKILNLDAYFRSTPGDKIIINDLNFYSIDDVETINNKLITVYNNTDVISTKPSCDCGELTGKYLLGKICPKCHVECKDPHSKVYPLLWLKALKPELKFLNPAFWTMLRELFTRSSIDHMRWLCDEKYNPPVKIQPYMYSIRDHIGGIRTYSNTMANLHKIITFLKNISKFKDPEKQNNINYLLKLFETSKEDLFSEYLPIVNKKLFIMENTTKGKFINMAAADATEVVMGWLKVVSMDKDSPRDQEMATARAISGLSELYFKYMKDYVVQKSGIIRKDLLGNRLYFSFRNVIVSRPGPHDENEIEVPWAIGPTVFRPHILNKLINQRGYTYKKATSLITRSVKKYEPVIDEILQELLAESPGKRIPVNIHRNPSLKRGSACRVYIKRFKSDNVRDQSVSFSQLIVKLGNGKPPPPIFI